MTQTSLSPYLLLLDLDGGVRHLDEQVLEFAAREPALAAEIQRTLRERARRPSRGADSPENRAASVVDPTRSVECRLAQGR